MLNEDTADCSYCSMRKGTSHSDDCYLILKIQGFLHA